MKRKSPTENTTKDSITINYNNEYILVNKIIVYSNSRTISKITALVNEYPDI